MSRDRRRHARATATIVATAGLLASTVGSPASAAPSIDRISLIAIGTYASTVFDGSAAEIVAHECVNDIQVLYQCAQLGAWTGVTNLVAATSNAPPTCSPRLYVAHYTRSFAAVHRPLDGSLESRWLARHRAILGTAVGYPRSGVVPSASASPRARRC